MSVFKSSVIIIMMMTMTIRDLPLQSFFQNCLIVTKMDRRNCKRLKQQNVLLILWYLTFSSNANIVPFFCFDSCTL